MRDQDYALAYAGLADCYLLLNVYNVASADDSFPKAEAASRKALSINESLAEAHTSLGFVTYRYHLKWAEAEEHFKKAIALNPNYATAHHWYASYLAASGTTERSSRRGEDGARARTVFADDLQRLHSQSCTMQAGLKKLRKSR